jgi:hypothetical protein
MSVMESMNYVGGAFRSLSLRWSIGACPQEFENFLQIHIMNL